MELSEKDIERFWNKVDKKSEDECWIWVAYKNPKGYGQINIKNKARLAHRISWIIHNGQIPHHESYHGYCICHTCDNPSCVNPSHLFLGTTAENNKDMNDKGRRRSPGVKGEKHGTHKLTEKQVIEIRSKYVPRVYSTRMLAKEYGMSQHVIQLIVTYKLWKHVIDAQPFGNSGMFDLYEEEL